LNPLFNHTKKKMKKQVTNKPYWGIGEYKIFCWAAVYLSLLHSVPITQLVLFR
jgi:hypothetical protein